MMQNENQTTFECIHYQYSAKHYFFFLNTTAGTAKNIEVNAYTGI